MSTHLILTKTKKEGFLGTDFDIEKSQIQKLRFLLTLTTNEKVKFKSLTKIKKKKSTFLNNFDTKKVKFKIY